VPTGLSIDTLCFRGQRMFDDEGELNTVWKVEIRMHILC
jgi:hypothetical protein